MIRSASKQNLSHNVYAELMQMLLQNKLVPGEILNRREVAAEMGVSVAPVLEAMLQLELEGFLESIPRKGTRVRPITAEDVYGQLIVREALECNAARMYCGEPIAANQDRLLSVARELEKTGPEDPEHWKTDIEFHVELVKLTGVQAMVRSVSSNIRLGIFYQINRLVNSSDRVKKQSHENLITLLTTEDPDEAHHIMREHIRSGKNHLFRSFEDKE